MGILGTGNMGSGFARHFSTAGHDVFVGSCDSQHGKEVGSVFRSWRRELSGGGDARVSSLTLSTPVGKQHPRRLAGSSRPEFCPPGLARDAPEQ